MLHPSDYVISGTGARGVVTDDNMIMDLHTLDSKTIEEFAPAFVVRYGGDATEATIGSVDVQCESFAVDWRVVKYGSHDACVAAIQALLNYRGADCGYPDGIWGNNTQAAYKAYIMKNQLKDSLPLVIQHLIGE